MTGTIQFSPDTTASRIESSIRTRNDSLRRSTTNGLRELSLTSDQIEWVVESVRRELRGEV
jgi:hypothetical protein